MDLLLDLSRLRGGVEQVDRRFEASAFDIPPDDFRVVSAVEIHAELSRDATKVRLVGLLSGTLELSCGRCLEPFEIPVETKFDLMFLPASETAAQSGEAELADADVGVSFYTDHHIDVGEVIREQFYLAVPMKPLCRPDCLGLCPVCGNNRNVAACTCQAEWVDPRLEPLRKLKNAQS